MLCYKATYNINPLCCFEQFGLNFIILEYSRVDLTNLKKRRKKWEKTNDVQESSSMLQQKQQYCSYT